MIKAFAPRDAGGSSWVLLSIVLMGAFPLGVGAQTPGPPPAAKAEEKAEPKPAPPPAPEPPPAPAVESFLDPRVAKTLENNFPQLGKAGGNRQLIAQVKNMAAGTAAANRKDIDEYVQNWIFDLTNRNNIRAVMEPGAVNPNSASQLAIQVAGNGLVEPILIARSANNAGFLTTYNRVLLQALPPLLENHYLARIEAIIALSQTGTPEAVPLFVKQLSDPNQTVWVALWAAKGLTTIEQLSGYNLDPSQAVVAAKAVSDYLDREKKLPWPVQFRALEALGSLRQASSLRPVNGQPEMATTATQFLTDPDAKLMVRAEAGWALGMMQVQAGIAQYNYPLIAHSIGDVAVALGDRVQNVFSKNPTQAEALTAILMTQVYQAFEGVSNVRETGLLRVNHPNANTSRPFIRQVADKSKQITAAAVKLVRGPGGQAQQNLKELNASVADLKTWLEQNRPQNAWLVPNGPVFPKNHAQVANAGAGEGQVANGPAGRGK